jgi:glutathione S-transferase
MQALRSSGGPYFLGEQFSMVDIMFTPFLERMAASLPYYKVYYTNLVILTLLVLLLVTAVLLMLLLS